MYYDLEVGMFVKTNVCVCVGHESMFPPKTLWHHSENTLSKDCGVQCGGRRIVLQQDFFTALTNKTRVLTSSLNSTERMISFRKILHSSS